MHATLTTLTDIPITFLPEVYLLHSLSIQCKKYRKTVLSHLINAAHTLIPGFWRQSIKPTVRDWIKRVEDIRSIEEQILSASGLASLYAMGLVIVTWLWPPKRSTVDESDKEAVHLNHVQLAHCILLLIESALFGLFVTVIFYDQIVSIINDETPIEQLRNRLLKEARKEVTHTRKPKMALLREVFGRGYAICWFFPCNSPPTSGGPAYSYLPDYDV
ncbi:palmitoyltransferase ZDHHC3-like [Pelobates cultripes]|uniref:Palmitoyltransferase ZDHHC3-like n=1 Tax=Pelobates cultripes TaxID=61616 RepID=A0AAD1WUR5_PELCU|nr:palmitoyltransferase ZDHHC3-like [Pelobates cultripes]